MIFKKVIMIDEEIKETILLEIEKTKKAINTYRELTKPTEPDVAIGRVSRMDAINNKSVVEAAMRKAEEKLTRLYQVLEKVGTKNFGICAKCHKPIPIGRILIRPESIYCVQCAQ